MVLGLVAVVIVAGWYFVFRSLGRERQVAELQSNFVAAVSHEFRSPLTALAHAADLLSTDRLPSEPLRREAYGVLTRETARLRGLVDGLLDSDRFGKGSAAFRFEPVPVDTLVVDAVEAFRGYVAPAGYAVELVGHASGLTVSADREALTRALWNLLDNAVKYSPDCHTVWVEVERTADRVAIGVRDRGIGIPEGEQSAIFERFVRGTVATSERIRGTGLGLALVRQIVEAHGGEVRLASELGKGSRFTLVLMTERVAASALA
jgi:signal transduction histidine kinase